MDSHQPDAAAPTAAPLRTRRRTRPNARTAGAVTALAAAFAAGTLVPDRAPEGQTLPGLVGSAFLPAAAAEAAGLVTRDCDALLRSYQERALAQVGPYGWDYGDSMAYADVVLLDGVAARSSAVEDSAASDDRAATSSETGTNVQEAGVDEPDIAKTDGEHLFRTRRGTLVTYDVRGDEPRELARTQLPGMRPGYGDTEILLVGDRLVALSTGVDAADEEDWTSPTTRVAVVDVSDPASPEVLETLSVDGTLDSVRQHGDLVRVVVATGLPALDFRTPGSRLGERSALAHNRRLVRRTTLQDWLPQGSVGDGDSTDLVPCDAVAVPEDETGALGTTSVLTLTPDSVDAGQFPTTGVALASPSSTTYTSTDRLYLATDAGGWAMPWRASADLMGRSLLDTPVEPTGEPGRTHLYAFALDGPTTTFTAAGTVDGSVANRWSMDSADQVLRVAVGPTEATGNFSSVLTLAERDGRLVETGRVDRLGVDEEIKSVRWFDDLAIVVTFRQTDPLYAVDLTDTDAPRLLGELKIPGYSQYLHPISDTRLIGVGQRADPRTGAERGGQAALFDIADLRNPRRLDTVAYPRHSWMNAAEDPRQFTWLPGASTAFTVVTDGETGRTAWLTQLTVTEDGLREHRTEVDHGHDVLRVRLLPLGERRVALVTGDGVRFVDVA